MHLVLFFLLMLVTAPARAEWVAVAETPDAVFYIDLATVRKDGDFRKVWQIADLKKPRIAGDMSRRALWEYNCKDGRERLLQVSSHSEPMARGKILASKSGDPAWEYVAPETAAEIIIKIACR